MIYLEIKEYNWRGKIQRIIKIRNKSVANKFVLAAGKEYGKALGRVVGREGRRLKQIEYKAGRAHYELEGIRRQPPKMLN